MRTWDRSCHNSSKLLRPLTGPQEKLIKIGAKVVGHGRMFRCRSRAAVPCVGFAGGYRSAQNAAEIGLTPTSAAVFWYSL